MTASTGEPRPSDQDPQLDPSQRPGTLDGSVTSVLGAVGSLLVAIASDGRPAPGRPQSPMEAGSALTTAVSAIEQPVTQQRPTQPPPEQPSPTGDDPDDVSSMLADARARAHELIDEAVAQAEERLREEARDQGGSSALRPTLEAVRDTIADVASEVRALHDRLD